MHPDIATYPIIDTDPATDIATANGLYINPDHCPGINISIAIKFAVALHLGIDFNTATVIHPDADIDHNIYLHKDKTGAAPSNVNYVCSYY